MKNPPSLPTTATLPIFLLVALISLWFGLRPFNFKAANDVHIDTATGQAIFNQTKRQGTQQSRGLAFTSEAVSFVSSQGITLQLTLTPLRQPAGLGHILLLYDGQDQAVFSITQWQDHLQLFSRRPLAGKGYREVGVRDLLPPTQPLTLTITSSPETTLVLVNARLVRALPGFSLLDPAATPTGQLILGNNARGTQPWHGSMKAVTIFNHSALDPPDNLLATKPLIHYTFATPAQQTIANRATPAYTLQIPERFTPLTRTLLASFPLTELGSPWLLQDILINIFGFMPLGLCFALVLSAYRYGPWGQFTIVVIFCFLFSMAIEAAQAWMPGRDSSLLDLACNTLGGGVAAAAVIAWQNRRISNQSKQEVC